MRVLGAILAGGRASRFGSDKALAMWRGRALIDHVAAALGPHVDGVVICGRDLSDRPGPDLGPLGGLNAALHHAAAGGFDRVLSAPCDTPLLDAALLAALARRDDAAFLAELPVLGGWPVALGPVLDAWLAAGTDRAMRGWARAVGAEALAGPVPVNVNTAADLVGLDAIDPHHPATLASGDVGR